MNLPEFQQGMPVSAIGPALRALRSFVLRQKITFSERFTVTQGVGGTTVDLANRDGNRGSESYKREYGLVATTITAASSQTQPGDYGSGTVTLDVNGGDDYTAGSTVTVKNRWPVSFTIGDLLLIDSTDNGETWFIVNRFCATEE
jgi:hypothetical protein